MPSPDSDLSLRESTEDLQLQAQESWTSHSENDESHIINDGDHPMNQVVEFHPDSFVQNEDFGPDGVIEVVHIQSPDPGYPQELRVLHFPISALTNPESQFEEVQRNQQDRIGVEEIETPIPNLSHEDINEGSQEEHLMHEGQDRLEISEGTETENPLSSDEVFKIEDVNMESQPEALDTIGTTNSDKFSNQFSPETAEIVEPVAEPFPIDQCANCMKLFEEEEEKLSRISRSVSKTDSFCPTEETTDIIEADISNLEALHLIFQLPKEAQRDDEECFLCKKCANILMALYSSFKEFTELTQEEAYVLRKLKEISAEESRGKKSSGKRRKQPDPKKMGSSNDEFACEIKAEVEWEEEEEEEDELIVGDFSDDEDFQASPSELAAAGIESSSSSSDDEIYVPVKKKKMLKQSRTRKTGGELDDFFWDNDIKHEGFSDDEFGKRRRKSVKRSGHKKSVLTGLTYDCNLCDESFQKPRALKRHLQEFHKKTHSVFDPLQEKPEIGEGVDPSVDEETSELKTEDVASSCRICGKELETRCELKDHFTEDHDGELPYKCDKCDRQFGETSALKRHEIAHTAEKPYKCRVCLSAFRRADELRTHWAIRHADDGNEEQAENSSKGNKDSSEKKLKKSKEKSEKSVVPCEVCGKAFARHDHLKLHLRIHTGEKPYKCTECGKAFSDPRGLAYHEVTHSNERPYCCTVCGMTFKRLHHLNDHERNHRDDIERPFACEICSKCFKYKKHLNSHMVIHGNSKDHQCEICGKAFNRKDNLRQHVKKVHGKEPGPSTMSFVVTTASQSLAATTTSAIVTQALPLDASLDQIVYMHL